MGQLAHLPNIGKVVEEQLNSVGITTAEQLVSIGAETAWLKIQSVDESACIHRLLVLEGAVRGIKKPIFLPSVRRNLRQHRTINALRALSAFACIFFVILHKFSLKGDSLTASNLYNLT